MTDSAEERLRRFRHDLANPLSALLAEAQLVLMSSDGYDDELRESLQEIEKLSLRMKEILNQI